MVVNDSGPDEAPVMTDDELTLYFASIRSGGLGQQDIYVATRADAVSNFSAPVLVRSLDSDAIETDMALSSDETEMFFVSDISGVAQIWHTTRDCR